MDILSEQPPNDKFKKDCNIYYRPGRADLIDYLFMKNQDFFEIGVWSSLDREKTSYLAKSFFGRQYSNLLFVSATNRQDYEGVKEEYGFNSIPLKRDFQQVFQKFQDQFDNHNTVLISNFPNMIESYKTNDIIVPQYDPRILGASFVQDQALKSIIKYIQGLKYFITKKDTRDIRPLMAAKQFSFLLDRVNKNSMQYSETN